MSKGWRVGLRVAGVVVAVAAAVLGVFWWIKGLEQAGWLAGVLSAFVALVTLAMFLYDRSRAESGSQPPDHRSGTLNTFQNSTSTGPVVMARDISGPVTSGAPAPPVPPRAAGAAPPPAGPAPEPAAEPASEAAAESGGDGAVSSTFSGGSAYGPVVMGRDISGPVTSSPTASGSSGDRRPQQDPDEPVENGRGEGERPSGG